MALISFIVPAWNEEPLLGRTIAELQTAAAILRLEHEIIVVDDDSTDRTAHIAREAGAQVIPVQHRHIAATRNAGAQNARGDLLFFVDADTLVNQAVINAALEAIRAGAIGGGCAFRFDGRVPLYARVIERSTMWVARRLRLANGCFIFCKREDFDAVGGFDVRLFAAEEWALSVALQRRGRFVILREKVITSGRKVRAHTGLELLRLMLWIGLRGPKALRNRAGLAIWYGDRREDRG